MNLAIIFLNWLIIMKRDTKLPDFIIVDAQKCGTTTLHYSLVKHPEIFMSNPKELDFLEQDENFCRGIEWYSSFFRKCPFDLISGEAGPEYFYYENVPNRIAHTLPSPSRRGHHRDFPGLYANQKIHPSLKDNCKT